MLKSLSLRQNTVQKVSNPCQLNVGKDFLLTRYQYILFNAVQKCI